MQPSVDVPLTAVWNTFRLADVLDIFVVAVLFYFVLMWFRGARSRLVLSGLLIMVALYFLARLVNLRLTLAIFQAAVTVAAVAIVVIFQEDIRRSFERMALARGTDKPAANLGNGDLSDVIAESTFTLAQKGFGALIVLRGKDPLERHITGGIGLDGQLSDVLLYSIFDESSPGHDGALVIENGLAARFGAHLPLSTAIDGRQPFGTRHTAALGLSERCDAACIVVSEERGQVSLARNGRLEIIDSPKTLSKALDDFMASVKPESKSRALRSAFTRDLKPKIASLVTAVAAWLVVVGPQTEVALKTMEVPLVLKNVPDGWVIEKTQPNEARVALSGPEIPLGRVQPPDVKVTVEVGELEQGRQTRRLTTRNVEAPSELTVQSIEPDTVSFIARRKTTADLKIQVPLIGSLPPGKSIERIITIPQTVRVSLPENELVRGFIRTAPVELSGLEDTASVLRPLELPDGAELEEGEPDQVRVRLVLQQRPAPSTTDANAP